MNRRTFFKCHARISGSSTAFPCLSTGKRGPLANGKMNVAFIGSAGWIGQRGELNASFSKASPGEWSFGEALWT